MRKIVKVLIVVAVLAALGVAAFFGARAWKNRNQKVPKAVSINHASDLNPVEATNPDALTDEQLDEAKASLTVDLTEADMADMYGWISQEFLNYSMPSQANLRTAAAAKAKGMKDGEKIFDAVSFPFSCASGTADEDIQSMYGELQEEVLRNPVVGDMILQGFKELKLQDGTSVLDLNPWAQDYITQYTDHGCESFLTYHKEGNNIVRNDNGDKIIFVTDEYVSVGKRILVLLDRCSVLGITTTATSRHYPLNDAVEANNVRTYLNTDKSYIDKAPALTLAITLKDGKEAVRFGFNVCDKRLQIFERKSSSTPSGTPSGNPTPTTPSGDPTPTPSDNPTPTPPPEVTPTPTPPVTPPPSPTPTPTGKKDPTEDPVHNGNADRGGGEGHGDTPDEPTPDPSKDDMGDGGDNGGHTDPGKVTPTPKPGNGGNDDSNPPSYGGEDHGQDPVDPTPTPGGEMEEPPI